VIGSAPWAVPMGLPAEGMHDPFTLEMYCIKPIAAIPPLHGGTTEWYGALMH
jgi:hypothetical protein